MRFGLHSCSFHGEVLTLRESPGLRLTEIAYGPNLRNPKHSHEYAYLGITLKGHSTQFCDHKVRSSKPWTVMYHPAGETHSDHFHEEGARELNIEMPPAMHERLRERYPLPGSAVEQNGGAAGWLAARLYGEFRLMDDLSWMAIEGLTIALMAEIFRENLSASDSRLPYWLRQASDLIRDKFAQRLTLGDIAETVGVHPVHLAREFHRHMGLTIGQQLRRLRVQRACDLLSNSNTALAEIALGMGFSDQSQFSKTFKRLVGVTPSAYRQSRSGC